MVKADGRSLTQQLKTPQRSDGVGVDGMPGRVSVLSRETLHREPENSTTKTSYEIHSKIGRAMEGVGILHSSDDLWDMRTHGERRENTCLNVKKRSEERGDGSQELPTPNKVRQLQITLYRKAKAEPGYRFWSLYGELLRMDVLKTAWKWVAKNGGAAGVDGQTIEQITATPETERQWLEELREELRSKSYRASPLRRAWIPKKDQGERPLGIPTVKDRVVQMAVYLVLMPIFETDFHPQSYGYRPKKNAHQAIEAIRKALQQGRREVIDADLSKYFDTIPHRQLMREIAKRISDGSILRLIKSWLRSPIIEEDERGIKRVKANRSGTPQGGVISPLLANLYLNPLDKEVNEQWESSPRMVRYADDFVILCWPKKAEKARNRLNRWLASRGLKLNETKTRTVDHQKEGFEFLGFNLIWRLARSGKAYSHVEPSQKSRWSLREKLRKLLHRGSHWRQTPEVIAEVNQVVRGWSQYFYHANNADVFTQMQKQVRRRVKNWLWRKQGRRRWIEREALHKEYGLYRMPLTAQWKHPEPNAN